MPIEWREAGTHSREPDLNPARAATISALSIGIWARHAPCTDPRRESMISLDATFNRRVVRAAVGDLLRIELPENVLAGNRWALPDPLPRQLRLVLDKTAGDRITSYAAGERRLEFRIVAGGSCSLSLVNARSWQQSSTSFELFIEAYEAETDVHVGPASSHH